jgi:hypothetical protein
MESLLAGQLADKLGRTTITIASMGVGGACALIVGILFGGNPIALVSLCLIWSLPLVVNAIRWHWAFALLAIGPIQGVWAMSALRRLPSAVKIANGNKWSGKVSLRGGL